MPVDAHGCPWMLTDPCGQPVDAHGSCGLPMDACYPWVSVGAHECLWVPVNACGCQWMPVAARSNGVECWEQAASAQEGKRVPMPEKSKSQCCAKQHPGMSSIPGWGERPFLAPSWQGPCPVRARPCLRWAEQCSPLPDNAPEGAAQVTGRGGSLSPSAFPRDGLEHRGGPASRPDPLPPLCSTASCWTLDPPTQPCSSTSGLPPALAPWRGWDLRAVWAVGAVLAAPSQALHSACSAASRASRPRTPSSVLWQPH